MAQQVKDLSVTEVIDAWKAQIDSLPEEKQKLAKGGIAVTDILLKILAEGNPISPQIMRDRLNLDSETLDAIFDQLRNGAGELDEDGNLVGLALSLIPTPHRFRVNGKDLYAWCSLDTFFLPGLLGETAEIESTCPVTNEPIRLTIGPEGIQTHDPPSTVLSIAVPGQSCSMPDAKGQHGVGAESEACRQMHFFRDEEAAATWVKNYPGVVVFTVEEAYRLARENWLARRN